jgi:hypothetical protein
MQGSWTALDPGFVSLISYFTMDSAMDREAGCGEMFAAHGTNSFRWWQKHALEVDTIRRRRKPSE